MEDITKDLFIIDPDENACNYFNLNGFDNLQIELTSYKKECIWLKIYIRKLLDKNEEQTNYINILENKLNNYYKQ